ncbi:hypothetical protein [Bosea sp. BK604]|uniref:hypothetical protein n=1 Tax=Bosea sp. BK604 TaxID=2512180 RepID=UPI001045A8E1|nr:hypothetical protein [Bosea sp. BK604]TCR64691.1 hypothetical protein EV560_106157 [Bosea sp. BK604]
MAKVKIYEKTDKGGKIVEHDLETVDAKEAMLNDPKRYSYDDPRAKKADRDPNAGPGQPRYKVEHIGGGKYNVIDTANDTIVDGGFDKEAAEAKATELGSGHATTSPNT